MKLSITENLLLLNKAAAQAKSKVGKEMVRPMLDSLAEKFEVKSSLLYSEWNMHKAQDGYGYDYLEPKKAFLGLLALGKNDSSINWTVITTLGEKVGIPAKELRTLALSYGIKIPLEAKHVVKKHEKHEIKSAVGVALLAALKTGAK